MFSRFVANVAVAVCIAVVATMLADTASRSTAPPADAVALPDLWIDKVILGDPPTVTAGAVIPYVFVVTNLGGAMPPGSTVLVHDDLPAEVTFISAAEAARGMMPFFLGVTCTFSAPRVECVLPAPLAAGDHFVVRMDVQLSAGLAGGNLVNQARVDPLGQVAESLENNNKDKVKVKVLP